MKFKIFAAAAAVMLLVGCGEKEIEVQLESTQAVTTRETQTVRETTLEWRQRMEQMTDIYVPIE